MEELIEGHVEGHMESKTIFGFWVYLMTDCIFFAAFFATYLVLHNNTAGGPPAKELFNLPYALTETLILLTSSFTCGIAMLDIKKQGIQKMLFWFAITFLLGISFLGMEINEFTHFIQGGNSFKRSAFLSSFFTLVSIHGCHISLGLLWMLILLVPIIIRKNLTPVDYKRLVCLRYFWHFLDVVWIFIFTIVYLMGVA